MEDAPVRLVVGDEGLLVERAVTASVAAARRRDPDLEVRTLRTSEITAGLLAELVSPSLFAEARVVVLEAAQDANAEVTTVLVDYAKAPTEGVSLVVVHAGGAKGKALVDGLKKAGAAVTEAAKLQKYDQRVEFVRTEVRLAGGSITGEALGLLLDAVGSDLRELASASSQLVSDSAGQVDAEAVRRFHRGRAEVTGFAVAERAVTGDRAGALEALRWALDTGVAHVLVADALADAVRTIARVSAAGRGDPYRMASELKMPPWKVKKAQGQARGWDGPGLTRAMSLVADVNADVKGAAADPSYALERATVELAALAGHARRR
ncbi:DNA polymerase III subunit delta [Actinomycetospora sp. TBRC 11914]|uniref:DNA polymerase III subunit delta n=1 Tax=Actinomycetospora sp. TBRC 11914 TaxID=2729387 RepID=UPI00145C633C|nr:DNA polymerase III subunit delta [Actinomycetospora sp. TBRC 11914]NMO91427.1 DNA polymerase III subunit delta [Actinomycetospora sp. TBRC 11914]